MEWKHYWRNVVKRYKVVIEGWPNNIPFRNLSDASSSLPDLETLLRKWRSGKIFWKVVTDNELKELDSNRDTQIESGDLEVPAPRRRRSDYGRKHRGKPTDDAPKKHCKPSRRMVVDSDEEEEPTDDAPRKRRKSRRTVVDSDEEDKSAPTSPTHEV
jgi:hypothetical protein